MKSVDLKNKNKDELLSLLSEKRDALKTFRFSNSGSRIKNVKEGMLLKRDIARIITVLNSFEK